MLGKATVVSGLYLTTPYVTYGLQNWFTPSGTFPTDDRFIHLMFQSQYPAIWALDKIKVPVDALLEKADFKARMWVPHDPTSPIHEVQTTGAATAAVPAPAREGWSTPADAVIGTPAVALNGLKIYWNIKDIDKSVDTKVQALPATLRNGEAFCIYETQDIDPKHPGHHYYRVGLPDNAIIDLHGGKQDGKSERANEERARTGHSNDAPIYVSGAISKSKVITDGTGIGCQGPFAQMESPSRSAKAAFVNPMRVAATYG